MRQINWTRVLVILLVILAGCAVLYVAGVFLGRFRHVIVLFVLGAMIAYVLSPLVRRLQDLVRFRWAAICLSYLLVAGSLSLLAVLLFTPFVQQSQSLVDNLQLPTADSLQTITRLEHRAGAVESSLRANASATIITARIAALESALSDIQSGTIAGKSHTRAPAQGSRTASPRPQTRVPPSYVKAIEHEIDLVAACYALANPAAGIASPVPCDLGTTSTPDIPVTAADRALIHARKVASLARQTYRTVSTTPIVLLRAQVWVDSLHLPFAVDLHGTFGAAGRKLSSQGSLLLNNAVSILQKTANTLLNTVLIVIISFYFLSDGGRMVRRAVSLIPRSYQDQAWYFVGSLDHVVGGYIRGQLLLSFLAGALGFAGAAVLGVPYPLLIGILTFLLESIPVIGPLVALVPAVAVSLFFDPLLTTILLAVWNILFQQLVTNILGPRIMGMAVGIHPLEAMLAVLVGYPLAGFLGAFLAVPVAGILHIVIRELYAYFVLGRALPTGMPEPPEPPPTAEAAMPHPGQRSAVG